MNYLIFIICFWWTFNQESDVQSSKEINQYFSFENDSLRELRKKAKKIDHNLNTLDKLNKDIYDRILETEAKDIYRHGSSVLDSYAKNDSLIKICVTYEGDRDTYISQFYFCELKLFYVLKTFRHYAPPKWDPKSKIVKEDSIEYFLTGERLNVRNNGMKMILKKGQLEAEALEYEKLLKE